MRRGRHFRFDFAAQVDPQSLWTTLTQLNQNASVHGMLVQLPLPHSFDIASGLHAISADKDVDGSTFITWGPCSWRNRFPPCTPYGVLQLPEHEHISLESKNVVIVGGSNIVGKPMALMLMHREATVSICHAKTRDLAQ
jgi:methylenetetrahydrofolate dehydrogenase (NADP+) / methenyltetrahydrofolate cyclohydrolase